MRSRYIVFTAPGQVGLLDAEVPLPGPGQLLCAAGKSLVSIGTELSTLRGVGDPGSNWGAITFPCQIGYSMAGRVVAVGEGVSGWREGDRVSSLSRHQQFYTLPVGQAYHIPDGVSDEEATWAPLATTTQLAIRRAELQLGESVAVVGLGILGQLVVQYLWLSGARRVVAIDPVPLRLEAARAHGATHGLALDAEAARAEVEALTNGRLLDAVIEVTGHHAVLPAATQLLRKLGRLVLLGDSPTPSQQRLGPTMVSRSLAILAIHGSMVAPAYSELAPWTREEMVTLFFDYLQQGRMRVADLVTHRFSPAEAPEAYARLVKDRSTAIGVIFDWERI